MQCVLTLGVLIAWSQPWLQKFRNSEPWNMKRKASQGPTKKVVKKAKPSLQRQNAIIHLPTQNRFPEKKNTDILPTYTFTLASAVFSPPAAALLCNGITQGVTPTTRSGRKVLMTSILCNWVVRQIGGNGGNFRIVLIYDKSPNGAFPASADIFEQDNFLSGMNLSNSDRFQVLMNEITPPTGTTAGWTQSGTFYRKLNLPIQFNNGNAGTIADITTGAVYILFSQTASIITTAPTASAFVRVRWIDN